MPLPSPAFRGADTVLAEANPEIGIGDIDASVTVASIAPGPIERPVDLGMPPAVEAVEAVAPSPTRRKLGEVVGAFTDAYLGAPPAPLGITRASAPIVPPVGIGEEGEPVDLMTSGSVQQVAEAPVQQKMPAVIAAGWIVQIGAAPSETGANTLLSNATGKVSSLGGFEPFVQRFEKDGQTFYRARFGGFSGKDAANEMCKQLKQVKMSCLAMQS
jgi:D-alanyl-D-alanine carboxypeptidase